MPPEAFQMALILGGLSAIASLTAAVVGFRIADAEERAWQDAQSHRVERRRPKPEA